MMPVPPGIPTFGRIVPRQHAYLDYIKYADRPCSTWLLVDFHLGQSQSLRAIPVWMPTHSVIADRSSDSREMQNGDKFPGVD
jgi:hypothetical protein